MLTAKQHRCELAFFALFFLQCSLSLGMAILKTVSTHVFLNYSTNPFGSWYSHSLYLARSLSPDGQIDYLNICILGKHSVSAMIV